MLARTRNRRATGNGNGNRLAIEQPVGKSCWGLTDSSSATEAGENRLNHGTDPTASLCSLERVVRPGVVSGDGGEK